MADISKVNGVAFSSIGGMNGVAKASIASLNGLSAPSSTVAPVVFYDAKNASSYGGSGTTWSDLKSGGYDMTLTNGPVFTSGTPDHFDFDGVNDIAVNNSNGPQIFGASSAYSFEAWVRLDGLLSASSTTPIYSIASKSPDSNTVAGWKWTLRSGSYNGMMLRMGDSGGGFIDITPSSSGFLTAINDTTDFHQVIVTIDESTSTALVYADGTQYSTTVTAYTGGALGNSRNNTSDLCLASYSEVSSSFEFNGDISEVAIYDKALSQAEVTALYNAKAVSFGVPTSGLLSESYGTGAAVAYSVRQLANTATKSMRIVVDSASSVGTVNSSDPQYDIGFDANGDLDTAAIVTACNNPSGTNYDAYVVKWYDQASVGGTNDAANSGYTTLPKIAEAGVVITENGEPAIEFGEGGNAKILEFDANMAVSLYYSVFAVRKGTTANGQMFLATQDDNRYWADLGLSGNDKHLMDGFNGDNGDYTNEWARYRKNGSAAFSGITTRSTYKSTFYNNNQLLMSFLTEGTALNRSAVTEFCIGAYQGLILPFQGTCQEFIMWQDSSSNQSSNASSIESNMTTHFSIS